MTNAQWIECFFRIAKKRMYSKRHHVVLPGVGCELPLYVCGLVSCPDFLSTAYFWEVGIGVPYHKEFVLMGVAFTFMRAHVSLYRTGGKFPTPLGPCFVNRTPPVRTSNIHPYNFHAIAGRLHTPNDVNKKPL